MGRIHGLGEKQRWKLEILCGLQETKCYNSWRRLPSDQRTCWPALLRQSGLPTLMLLVGMDSQDQDLAPHWGCMSLNMPQQCFSGWCSSAWVDKLLPISVFGCILYFGCILDHHILTWFHLPFTALRWSVPAGECKLLQHKVKFLGHVVNCNGVKPDQLYGTGWSFSP